MRRRLGARVALPCSVLALVLVVPAGRVSADSPSSAGWWTSENPGAPVSASEVVPIATPSGGGAGGTPSDVPKGGLEVASGPQGVISYAAVGFYADGASVTSLTLQLAPSSVDVPNSTVEACPLNPPGLFTVAYGAPAAAGPSYSCQSGVYGVEDPASGTVTFAVGRFVTSGYLGVAIVGVGNGRLVFSPPGPSTVKTAPDTAAPAADEASSGSTTAAPTSSPAAPAARVAEPATQSGTAATTATLPPAPNEAAPHDGSAIPAGSPAQALARTRQVAVTLPSATIGAGGAAIGAVLLLALGLGVVARNRRIGPDPITPTGVTE